MCPDPFPRKEGGIQVLAGLAPLSQSVGAVLRTTWPGKPTIKIEQNVSLANSLHWKNHSTTFDKMHSAKSKIQQTFLLPKLKL
jgi:hypothetical protein